MAVCPEGHQSVATDYCDECGLSIGGAAPVPAAASSNAATHVAGMASAAAAAGEPCPNCLLPRAAGDTFCEGCGFDFANEVAMVAPAPPSPMSPAPPVSAGSPAPAPPAPDPFDIEAELAKAEAAAKQGAGTGAPAPAPTSATDPLAETIPAPPPPAPMPPAPATAKWKAVARADRAYYDQVVAEGEIDADLYPFPPYCPERTFELSGENIRIGRSSANRGQVEIDLSGPPADPGVSHLHAVLQARPDGGWAVIDLESMNGTVLNDDTAPIPANQAIAVEAGHRIHVGVWTTLTLVKE